MHPLIDVRRTLANATTGWAVEYLIRVRGGNLKTTGYVSVGYYGGGFLGRLLLAEPTHRYGERRMVLIYAVACVIVQIMFWTIPSIAAGAVLFSALGFFSGPFFPTVCSLLPLVYLLWKRSESANISCSQGISVASKLCPKPIQHTALGFIFVLAQAGGSLFPTLTGLIAAHAGVKVLQPILVGLFALVGASWWFIPKVEKVRES